MFGLPVTYKIKGTRTQLQYHTKVSCANVDRGQRIGECRNVVCVIRTHVLNCKTVLEVSQKLLIPYQGYPMKLGQQLHNSFKTNTNKQYDFSKEYKEGEFFFQ